ncbi:MAG: hypothetical protein A2086_02795 [Spirochaetes bacterium GWD1_27_9]|nr:MAG: hypothetical protein A2Z98_14480 [Spirochaetes bacterium GWB1_27_13]OHD27262.1 MAG: hypothetical protein A2Y34_17205 [Spirochaetes bacterium GWC1_27_15]OHD31379.1 MAG: hypothetical protein A2086_02795 [Spirochaetes bacterium GWD1_27_9]
MFKKHFIIIIAMFTLVFAYSADPKYVDVVTAKNRISALEKTNTDLNAKADSLRTEIKNLEEKNVKNTKQIEDIKSTLDKVNVRSSALYYYAKEVIDVETKKAAMDSYNKNLDLKKKLEAKKEELEKETKSNNEKIQQNTDQICDSLYKVERNTYEIRNLQASIDKTNNQTEYVNGYIKQVDSFTSEAEALLK